ncbi:MAG: BamA/TamA family outer membrane protein [Polyangiaceae bacterium]
MRGSAVLRRLLALLSLLLATALSRAGPANGDPDIEWWTIETTHFRIHYGRHLEPIATRLAQVCEGIHDRLSLSLGYSPDEATHIVLTDNTDSANGSAIAIPINTIRLFVSAPDDMSPLGDYDDWYLDLVTHEYTHILHTDNVSGLPVIVNAILGKSLTPNRLQPNWVIEGLAVVKESEHSSAGRVRGSIYEMYLRTDVIEDNIARLDEISNITYRWPQRTLWYLYGSRFLAWIGSVYGKDTMRAVAADYGSHLVPGDINRTIRRVTGRTYVELYEGFQDHIRRKYAAQMASIDRRGRREGVRLTHHGRDVGYARFVPTVARSKPAEEEIVFFRDNAHDRAGIYRMALGQLAPGVKRDEELVARTSGNSTPAFTPRGDLLFASVVPDKLVYPRYDLFALPAGETAPGGVEPWRKRLTEGRRAAYPDVSADGKKVVFTINSRGTTYLTIADLTPEWTLENQRTLVPSARFEQAYTPRFSPNGKEVAYSAWSQGGYRDIRIVDVATGAWRRITSDRALDIQPTWSADGRTLYFASDRTGVFNVYAYDLADGRLFQVTNVRTGAFSPAVSADGKTLVYTGYGSEGYDLYAMPLSRARFLEAPPAPTDRPDPPSEAAHVAMRKTRYNPLPTFGPRRWSFEYVPGNYGGNALTIEAGGADVVGHHAFNARITVDSDAPNPTVDLSYVYSRLPFDYSARFFYVTVPRGGYRIDDENPLFNETNIGVTNGISLPIPLEFSNHSLGLSYSLARVEGSLPVPRDPDPYATTTVRPLEGNIGVVHFGYGLSTVEGSLDATGAVRGVALNIGVDVADDATNSDFSVRSIEYNAAAYIGMPWLAHTVALRSAGGISGGNYPRGALFYVGGYDLENNSFLDTLTSNTLDGAFALRGYDPRIYGGRAYVLQTAEYRFPILYPDRGLSTLPLFLRRIDGAMFVDYGGAFNRLELDDIKLFDDGYLINSPQLHGSVGGEIWLGTTLAYGVNVQFRGGYAYGFSREAIPGGQPYFIAAGSF